PLLRKEEGKPLVDGHLPLIRLDGAEVGIDRGVDGEVGETEPRVDARARIEVLPLEAAGRPGADERRGHERLDLGDDPALHAAEPRDGSALRQEAAAGPAGVGPRVLVAAALGHADDVEAPALRIAAGKAEALEGNADL